MNTVERFPPEIHQHLQNYVYRLIDPRDGSTFYVGRGQKDRVFAHAKAALIEIKLESHEDEESLKLRTIKSIRNAGLQPLYVIHRHGMTNEQAEIAEAILIDMLPGLSNIAGGYGSRDRGALGAIPANRTLSCGSDAITNRSEGHGNQCSAIL